MPPRAAAALILLIAAVALLCALPTTRRNPAAPRISTNPSTVLANGYDTATVTIQAPADSPPRLSLAADSAHAAIGDVSFLTDRWQARIRAGITPGRIALRIDVPNRPPAFAEIQASPDTADSAGDGTPDVLRLDDDHDRRAFRAWFTFLAESQYFQPPAARPAEIVDCAALIRFAYREALHVHDAHWATGLHLPVLPAIEPVAKYQYPFTPLGAALFRVGEAPAAFAQFADAQTLARFNTHRVSRTLTQAQPGDLLFFRQATGHVTFHSMIYLGASQITRDASRYLVYHTGPEGDDPGIIRRLTVDELLRYPEPQWRPVAANPGFLGLYRWNILRDIG